MPVSEVEVLIDIHTRVCVYIYVFDVDYVFYIKIKADSK